MENIEYAKIAAKVLSDKKANDIKLVDIREKASFADYLIIATGQSERQVNGFSDYIEDELAKYEQFVKSIEGKTTSEWILMDFGDIIINLFTPQARDKYNLEKVWGDCPVEEIE
ncbi:MAG: ribosome silencing factor [Clostridia bacterium]|nr:ribosome silencing factor [Clostridia bacterium]